MTNPNISDTLISQTFNAIVNAAVAGKRAPLSSRNGGSLNPDAVKHLVKAGKIRIEIFVHNFRVITILSGEHAGKHTAQPNGKQPHLIIDADGQRRRWQMRSHDVTPQ
jgi:hypothetical protein